MRTIELPPTAAALRLELFQVASEVLTDHIIQADGRTDIFDHACGVVRIEMPHPPHLDVEVTVVFDPECPPEDADALDARFDFPRGSALRLFRQWWPPCA